ncbi:MAG: sensor histidine kinase, partial [Longimicrobiales bacterium]
RVRVPPRRRAHVGVMRERRFRLLPPGGPYGWTPYAWLVYLPTFLIEPIARATEGRASAGYLAATAAGVVVFLVSYFRGYWVRGVKLVPIIAVQTALGIAFAPVNPGASIFFIYAAAFAGQLDRARSALQGVVLVAAIAALTAFVASVPVFFWISAVGFSLLIGAVNLHFSQSARAHRTLRLAQEEVEHLAKVAERERIARDMHDVLGHTLSLIVLKAELASRLAEWDPTRAAAEMRDVEEVARRTLQDVREAIRGYHATLGEEAERARSMLKAAGIRATFELEEIGLPRAVEETLALSLREAVTNVVRHSGATLCTATLAGGRDVVTLDVCDDGRGSTTPEGAGLRGMRERVEVFDGSVTRPPGRGMRLRITLPAKLPEPATETQRIPDTAS